MKNYLPTIAATLALALMLTFNPGGLQSYLGAQIPGAGQTQPGDGLKVTYFKTTDFQIPVLERIEPTIDFDLGSGAIAPEVPPDFSAIWTGQILAEETAEHTFFTIGDDGVKLTIDGKLIIDDFNVHPATEQAGKITLTAGKRYDLKLEYFDDRGLSVLKFSYQTPSAARQIVPQRVLYSAATTCSDGKDNDNDGKIDFPDDPGCTSPADENESEKACSDGLDNDNDGKIDFPDDTGCDDALDDDELNVQCSDGIDNDADGNIDFPNDIGCTNRLDDDEANPECSDGIDNDGDGATDFPNDDDCDNLLGNDEGSIQCSDGIDNDGDGATDFPDDSGCDSATDDDESNTQCSDGKDNDADGNIDFPDDLDCDDFNDEDESSPEVTPVTLVDAVFVGPREADNYPLGILAGGENNIFLKVPKGSSTETVPATLTPLPPQADQALQNGVVYPYVVQATGSDGKKYVALTEGRYWDPDNLSDPAVTSSEIQAFITAGAGDAEQCAGALATLPGADKFFTSRATFQYALELLAICKSQ